MFSELHYGNSESNSNYRRTLRVLGITTNSEINIPGYIFTRKDRNHQGGGVGMFIKNSLTFNVRSDIGIDTESIWVDLFLPKTKPILIGVCYRPPKHNDFIEKLEQSFSNCDSIINNECIILGDFNINVASSESRKANSNLYTKLENFMSMYNLAQLISAPTRITTYTSSVIDLIFVSDPNKISQSGVGDVCTSDHQLIYCTRKLTQTPIHEHKWMKIRSFKNYSKNILETKLGEVDWSMVINKENVEDAWKLFKSTFIKVIDSVAPLKTVRVKQRSEPWVTGEILQCIRDRTKIFRKFKRTKEPSLYSK